MSVDLVHPFVSAVPNTLDPTKVGSSSWNDKHTFQGGLHGDLLFRDTTAANGANWLPTGDVGAFLISGGVDQPPVWTLTPSFSSLTLTTPLVASSGGTGHSSYTVGDTLYASTTTALSRLSAVADGNVLRSTGVGFPPTWGKVRLSGSPSDVTGTLPAANGGLGIAQPYTTGAVLYMSSPTVISQLNPGTPGQALVTSAGAVAWGVVSPVGGGLGLTVPYTTGALFYPSNDSSITQLTPGFMGQVLMTQGAGAPPIWRYLADAVMPGQPSLPVLFQQAIPDAASADYDITVPTAIKVLDVLVIKQGGAGNAAEDSVTVKNSTSVISNAIALGTDASLARATSIDDAVWDLSAGGTLRISTVRGSGGGNNTECLVIITAMRREQTIPGRGTLTLTGYTPTRTP